MRVTAAKINQLCRSLSDEEIADENFVAMISDLACKCTGSITAQTDLLNKEQLDEPGKELLKKLDSVSPILNPDKVFCHFTSKESINALKLQLSFHKDTWSD